MSVYRVRSPRISPEWIVTGLVLVVFQVGMLTISTEFGYGREVLVRPVGRLIGLMCLSGIAYLTAVLCLRRPFAADRHWWVWMIGVGIAMRLLALPSTPMMEDDYYRYLWDGALVAHGYSPYAQTPDEIAAGAVAPELVELATSATVLDRVNHPWLNTIYPPFAQLAFAAAYLICPWHILGLRLTWSLFDVTTLVLLAALTRAINTDLRRLVIYWWNPLLVKEIYNSAHMDILVLPFIVGALLLVVRGRYVVGAIALAAGAGVKLWPLILAPVLLRHEKVGWRRATIAVAAAGLAGAVFTAPLTMGLSHESSGLHAYASRWEMNDTLYTLLYAAGARITPNEPHAAGRAMAVVMLLAWVAWVLRTPAGDGRQMCHRTLWTVAVLFLLSPTQFPWYWIWMLPMLTVTPSFGLLALTATLPLYYLRFPMEQMGYAAWFDFGVVWIQFSPVFAAIGWEAWQAMRTRAKALERQVSARVG